MVTNLWKKSINLARLGLVLRVFTEGMLEDYRLAAEPVYGTRVYCKITFKTTVYTEGLSHEIWKDQIHCWLKDLSNYCT